MSGNLIHQINVSVDEATFLTLAKIHKKHKLKPPELTRALLEEACAFYEKHGWFSVPVTIEPEAFQAKYAEGRKGKKE